MRALPIAFNSSSSACAFCESSVSKLYRVPARPNTTAQTGLAVCRFCYLHIVGMAPHRTALVSPVSPKVDPGKQSATKPG